MIKEIEPGSVVTIASSTMQRITYSRGPSQWQQARMHSILGDAFHFDRSGAYLPCSEATVLSMFELDLFGARYG